jgi:hypothetical protein
MTLFAQVLRALVVGGLCCVKANQAVVAWVFAQLASSSGSDVDRE